MAGYLDTTKTISVRDYYGDNWTEISVTITVSAGGAISYSTYSTNSGGTNHWKNVGLYLSINGNTIYNGYYTSRPFPAKHDSSESGTAGSTSSGEVSYDLRVCCMQDGSVGNRWWDGTAEYTQSSFWRDYWYDIPAPNLSITDNYDNSFTIKAIAGGNAQNNQAKGLTDLNWGYNTNYSDTYSVDKDNTATLPLTISGTGKTRTVYVKAATKASRGSNTVATASKAIRQYVGPNAPTNLKITYSKSKLTVRENWTLSWTAPTINNECPVKGYRIRLYRKRGASGSWITLPIYDSTGSMGHVTKTVSDTTSYFWDRNGTSTSATVYTNYYNKDVIPDYPDILPGDIIKFAVTAYTRYGENNDGALLFKTGETFSSEYTVQNAGIVRINSNGEWKEGQVYINANGTWKEATSVFINSNGAWKESQ